MAKTFNITADVQVKVWQNCKFKVKADSLEEAKEKIRNNPQSTCTGYETLTDTEEVIDIDLDGDNFSADEVYYQPEFKDGTPPISEAGHELYSFEVYRDKDKCQKDFPDSKVITYSGDDIEDPTFVD